MSVMNTELVTPTWWVSVAITVVVIAADLIAAAKEKKMQ